MSVHKSLKSKGKLVRQRNVLTRWERILTLVQEERWTSENDSPYGLPKVRVVRMKKRVKEKKSEAEEGEAAASSATEESASE